MANSSRRHWRAAMRQKKDESAVELQPFVLKFTTIPKAGRDEWSHLVSQDRRRVLVRIFISYRSQEPDLGLARGLFDDLKAQGHSPFMAGESLRLGDEWPERIGEELELCDYFILLLSKEASASEMVTEEVRRAKMLRDTRRGKRPQILPILVRLPQEYNLNYDLAGYLNSFQHRLWHSDADTPSLLSEIADIIHKRGGLETTPERIATALPDIEGGPPLPVAEPELPEGQVELASTFYIERPPIEKNCYDIIGRAGSLIRIKAARQMGKTSLVARILHQAATLGHITVAMSFQLADLTVFSQLDELLSWFCAYVSWSLDIPDQKDTVWRATGSKMRCTAYFERYLLPKLTQPLTIALDEADLVFQFPDVASDFFGLLRAWHESGKNHPQWRKLRLVLAHSTEVYIPLKINQSPFNVGLSVKLPEFTQPQVSRLVELHGLKWKPQDVQALMTLVGGHPFLVRLALYNVAQGYTSFDELLETATTESGLFGDHLRRHLWNIETYSGLGRALREVVSNKTPVEVESETAFKLESLGLVRFVGNVVSPRCELYRLYFRDRLGVAHER